MGYPQQPQDPYGQQHPQQTYGHSGPQPQYGYQPPTSPPPSPRRSNVGLIVLLAVGIPLLLLGGCAAVALVLVDTGREAVVTEADSPNMVMPSKEPSASAPPAENSEAAKEEQPSTATIGGAITLQGMDPGLKVTVTLNKVVNPATGDQFSKPQSGNKFVALEVTLANQGQAVYSDTPTNGAILIDSEGQQYRSTFHQVQEGQSFGGLATINTGDTRKGVIVFEVPEPAKLAKFQFALNSGFADQKGEWTLS
ncbi:DUF4352 domain-containing protein [Nonomuraea turkmeniaca]|uniref:DUF4352 domain-containing protein n=1 Tax=Nonomuraea turkmeniaca TaxID=103838 RepID=A0A5S4FIX6_9ACTN|nr:DUF4352 domain-containing protein [Nonomuraea turkmeniaca]TMR09008.1 DUF4352 domain-containing protein [Nonomuraea turkmeniaca]